MNKPRWRKIFADIFENKMRSVVVLASITIGVFAIGLIGTIFQLVLQETHETYQSANPANIHVQMTEFNQNFIDSLLKNENISQAEGRRISNLSIIDKGGNSEPFQVVALENFDQVEISTLYFVDGKTDLEKNEILVVVEFMEQEDLHIGDILPIELSNGKTKDFKIVGTVEDWTLQMDKIFIDKGLGFINMDSLPTLNLPSTYNTLFVTVAKGQNELKIISQINNQIIEKIEDSGRIHITSEFFTHNTPPLNSLIISIVSILIFLGLLIMVLSGFLIANTMNALLLQQSRQIGVMKLMGAKRKQLIELYLSLSLIYGLVSLFLAVPSALYLGRFAANVLSDFINTQITDVPIIPWLPFVILIQVVVSILIPVSASLLPVLKGTEKTVKQALSGNLVSTEVDDSKFDRWLESLPGINAISKISVRNTFRRKGRLFTTIFALALAGAIFIAVFNTQGSLNQQMEDSADLMGVDINISFNKMYNEKKVEETLMSLPEITFAEAWGTDIAYFKTAIQEESVSILAPDKHSLTIHPTLTSGRWFKNGDHYAIVVNKAFLDRSDEIELGSKITLELNGKEKQWTIIGTTHVMGDDDLEAYISKDMWEKETKSTNSSIAYRIILEDHSLENQLSLEKTIYDWLESQGYHVSNVTSVQKMVNSAISMLDIVIWVLLILAILTAIVGSIGMTGTLSMNILERTSEIGILRAIGGNNQIIRRLVIIEGIIIGCISYFFSVILSFPVTLILKSLVLMSIFGTAGKFILSWQGFVIWLGLVLIFSIFASVVPAKDATNLTIREVLAYE